jgi:hypothetical protein
MWDKTWVRVAAGAAVVALFAGIAIGVVTLLGGDSLSEPEAAQLPAPTPSGPQPPAERSSVADLLESKGWNDMTHEEREAAASEFVRAYHNAEFRTGNVQVLATDVWRRDGQSLASRVYFESGEPGPDGETFLYARTTFYCDLPGGGFRAHRYLKSPTETQYELSDPGTVPRTFDDAVIAANWSGPVRDLGIEEIGGRQARGFELGFRGGGGDDTPSARYWFDVETAQLVQRAEVVEKEENIEKLAFTIDYSILPPIDISGASEVPDCVQDIIDRLQG